LSNSKPKPKDDSTNKFLQRIAGKKALGPPPTPRPVIGEHPVRTLMRENRDDDETPIQENTVRTELLPEAPTSPVLSADNILHKSQIVADSGVPVIEELDSQKPETAKNSNKSRDFDSAPVEFKPDQKAGSDKGERSARLPRANKELPSRSRSETIVSPRASAESAEAHLSNIRSKYRLNVGEFALYKELYMMTYAIGKTECSFVVSELMKSTGMLERRVRDNIRRLKKNGWIVLLEGYDFENREKAKYRVNIEPEA
jgi:hypothetical protein